MMDQPANRPGMPLFIWFRTLIVALIFLTTLYIVVDRRDKRLYGDGLKSNRIENASNGQDDSIDLCFLGSSLTRNAFIGYNSLNATIGRMKSKIHYKVMFGSGVCLEDFNEKIREIRNLHPRYLLIESNMACLDLTGNAISKFKVRLAVIPLYFIIMGSSAFKLIDNQVPASFIERHDLNLEFDNLKADFLDLSSAHFRIRKIHEFPAWDSFFQEATKLGIKVCFLNIPRSAEAEQNIPDHLNQQLKELIQQYKNEYNIEYIEFPGKLSRKRFYLDRAHFNKSGSYYYCDWLMKELGDEIN